MLFFAMAIVIVAAESFLLGSIPWGVVLSRFIMHDDVREHGSGNIGTTNMMRTYGKKLGIACFVLDFTKALGACLLAQLLTTIFCETGWITPEFAASNTLVAIATFACVYGHIFSPWLGFKGGKGIAAGVGCLFVAYGPLWAIIELALFGVLTLVTRYVSVGSIAAALLCCVLAFVCYWPNIPAVILMFAVGATVFWAHRANLSRLMNGTENKIGSKKKAE